MSSYDIKNRYLKDGTWYVLHPETKAKNVLIGETNVEAKINEMDPKLPTAEQKSALVGTNGTPGNVNRYVTNSDPRLTDARPPSEFNANLITSGTIDVARLPKVAIPDFVEVADEAARFALTISQAQNGDVVQQTDNGHMYLVIDHDKLDEEAGYREWTAGAASTVPWAGVTDKPVEATPTVGGFMSPGDKSKLDGIANNANNYNHPNHSGDVTSVGDGAQTIAPKAVTLAKMADLVTDRLIGRVTAGTGVPEALTAEQVRTFLNVADGAGANVDTNLGNTRTATNVTVTSSNGSDTTISGADASNAGVMVATDKVKLNGIATGAQVNNVGIGETIPVDAPNGFLFFEIE